MPDNTSKHNGRKLPKSAWKPGCRSPNPGGRPTVPIEVREAARAHSDEAIATLAKWMRSDHPQAAVRSSEILLDRAWGKPDQRQEITGPEGIGLFEALASKVFQFTETNTTKDDSSPEGVGLFEALASKKDDSGS